MVYMYIHNTIIQLNLLYYVIHIYFIIISIKLDREIKLKWSAWNERALDRTALQVYMFHAPCSMLYAQCFMLQNRKVTNVSQFH